MPEFPNPLPENGKFRALFKWLNDLRGVVYSLRPLQSHNVLTEATAVGAYRQALRKLGEGDGGGIQWKQQWVAGTSYLADDLVIRKTDAENDTGKVSATYIALVDLGPNDLPPGEDAIAAAAAATLTAGAVTGYTLTEPGLGYLTAPDIVVTGDGTGATAHAVITNGRITSIVIDTPGTGYTSAGFTIDTPAALQGWDVVAQFNNQRFTWAKGDGLIVVDVGRDSGLPRMTWIADVNADIATGDSVSIDTADIAGKGPMAIREWAVCHEDGDKARFLSTLPYF